MSAVKSLSTNFRLLVAVELPGASDPKCGLMRFFMAQVTLVCARKGVDFRKKLANAIVVRATMDLYSIE